LVVWDRVVKRRKGDDATIMADQAKKKPKYVAEIDEEATVWRDDDDQKPGYGTIRRKKR
jgi:hypothetical protein